MVFQKGGPMGLSYMGNGPQYSVEDFGDFEMERMQAEGEAKAAIVQSYVEEQAWNSGRQGKDLEDWIKMPGEEEEDDEETDEKQLKARNWDDWVTT